MSDAPLIGFTLGSTAGGRQSVPWRTWTLPVKRDLVATTVLVASNEPCDRYETDDLVDEDVGCHACGEEWTVVMPSSAPLREVTCPQCREHAAYSRPLRTLTFVRQEWRLARRTQQHLAPRIVRATWRRKWLRRDWR